jgi:hypothetical protein
MKFNPVKAMYLGMALTVVAFCGFALLPVFACGCKVVQSKTWSISNIKQLATGAVIYTTDYDDRLPLAATWGVDLVPYTKNEELFNDPFIRPAKFGYAFFTPVAGLDPATIERPDEVPLIFQSLILAKNAHSDLRSLPLTPRVKGTMDIYAHLNGGAKARPREWALNRIVIRKAKP